MKGAFHCVRNFCLFVLEPKKLLYCQLHGQQDLLNKSKAYVFNINLMIYIDFFEAQHITLPP